ncbi:MAG: N-acetylmuramoyl-L-alanine amidase [Candidatus Brocadia sinica]|nr:MAG: N-acetylmuramoyl-L-alanine amidase [Candidatus Brocadia sinica]MCK6469696.1 peptidoglycan recognition protein family protein [Candidatus Brocadia sinica]NUO05619.1 N-acetylmuramoyl-L-alanine amidase [Candidatus Brocadia sinica]
MHSRWRIYICVSFLAVLGMHGCHTPPAQKSMTVMKPRESATIPEKSHERVEPYIVSRLDRYFVRDWKYIVIHHSASASGSAVEFDRFHREKRGWENGLGYHFVIGNGNGTPDGEIEIGNRWVNQINGAHAGVEEYNHYGIGICLVGNFNESSPTAAQMASLSVLTEYLQNRCHIPSENVIMHRHCRQTDCPGRNFPYYKLLANTYRY